MYMVLVCVCVPMHNAIHTFGGQSRALSVLRYFCLIPLKHGLPLSSEVSWWPVSSRDPISTSHFLEFLCYWCMCTHSHPCALTSMCTHILLFRWVSGALNSVSHTCTANNLTLLNPLPGPDLFHNRTTSFTYTVLLSPCCGTVYQVWYGLEAMITGRTHEVPWISDNT